MLGRKNTVYLKKRNPIVEKFLDLWEDFDIWFWRRVINPISSRKDRLIYAWERAWTGFDRRISWSEQPMIDFYVRLLTDLIEHAQSRPMGIEKIVGSERISPIFEKWNKILGTEFNSDCQFCFFEKMSAEQEKEFSSEVYALWKDYLREVRQCFLDASPDTCSQKNEYYDDFSFNPTWIEKEDGYFEMKENLSEEQIEKNKKFSQRERELEEFRLESLKRGLAEITKNPYAFSD